MNQQKGRIYQNTELPHCLIWMQLQHKQNKRRKKQTSKIDVTIIALIVISILLAVLIYTKSGVIGLKLNEILGGLELSGDSEKLKTKLSLIIEQLNVMEKAQEDAAKIQDKIQALDGDKDETKEK